jgi:hypothetical protein
MARIVTTKEFIEKAKSIHGDKYCYDKVIYKKAREKVIIICKRHKKRFHQTPDSHLRGSGCPICGKENHLLSQVKTINEFIKEADKVHECKYDYSKVKYKNCKSKILIICPQHGEFKQEAKSHLTGRGCPECGKNSKIMSQRSTVEEFIEKSRAIHNYKYNYEKVLYIDDRTKVNIMCKKHGNFRQSPNNHLRGSGCPHCILKSEGIIKNFLHQYFSEWKIISHKRIWNKYKNYSYKRYCDFWMEKDGTKVIVEYDGKHHFFPVRFNGISIKKAEEIYERTRLKDKLDAEFCEENDIILHRIRYDEDKKESIIRLREKI